ncbi:MAG: hypothetical protein K0Q93_395 [Nocardioidaceae bacterium]|nr:hypothetical protein [Nocardioidaceae bacterium]
MLSTYRPAGHRTGLHRTGLLRGALGAIGALALGAAAVAGPATADDAVHDGLVSANPSNHTPDIEDGRVNGIARVGDAMIAGGTFTDVSPAGGGDSVARDGLVAFAADTGAIRPAFHPTHSGRITSVLPAGDGATVYVAGSFRTFEGETRSRVAQIDATDGSLVPGFKPPGIGAVVNDLALSGDTLYIGGAFKTVKGQPRSALAALDASTGADTGSVDLAFSNTWNGGKVNVQNLDVSPDGSRLVAIGNWRRVDGQSRPQIAVVNTAASPATVAGWATAGFTKTCAGVFDTYMRDVDIAPSGDYFVVVTTGAYAGGQKAGTLCDTASRWELRRRSAGQTPTWVNYTGGDSLTAVKITGASVYVGGHQRWMDNGFGENRAGPGAIPRAGLAALEPADGAVTDWDPGRARGYGVTAFESLSDGLWIGHDTNRLGGEVRKRVAFMPLP